MTASKFRVFVNGVEAPIVAEESHLGQWECDCIDTDYASIPGLYIRRGYFTVRRLREFLQATIWPVGCHDARDIVIRVEEPGTNQAFNVVITAINGDKAQFNSSGAPYPIQSQALKSPVAVEHSTCRGCGEPIDPARFDTTADGCPCNSHRGINHGLVPEYTCTCDECDPARTGSVRPRKIKFREFL